MTQLQSTLLATSLISTLSHDIRDEVISNSESSNKSLAHQFGRLREDLLPILKEIKDKKPLPTPDSKTTLKTHYFPSSPQQLSRESSVRRGASSRNSSSSEILSERASIRSSSRPSSTEFASIKRNSGEISMKTASIYTQDTLTSLPSTISSAEIMTASAAVKVRPALVPLDSGGGNATSQSSSSTNIAIPRPSRHHSKRKVGSSNEPLKQLRARTEDKCYKILQAAMKSHGLDISDWKKYALVIVYGGDQERVLGYDEKPVLVFKELNELGLNPSMMLRQVDEEDGLDYPEFDTPGGRL
ncbi:DEKNAAC101916 [Brettanomyces naardenensis]|uniref:DEKNAAC101916 n=1 Tax=Brettanomyces naardenensis TaxID=13370 RepID=A0A448YJR8_BRENA|nr:DEKNAAC101916 [Brettanomyces naardenensis]